MDPQALSPEVIRTVRHRRAGLEAGEFTWQDVDDSYLDEVATGVLAMDLPDPELALIGLDIEQLGYMSCGHLAAVLNWVADQPIRISSVARSHRCKRCHRELRDAESIAIGFGPECRKAVSA